ncbi:MAG TPA: 5-oxoprolinase/urea amidolyase family protein [Thermoleophilaceae bacterium]|nr:5-oxoprolinase/urea amidolyase family protein [Thermoleophilaceae bacterium]
MASAGARAAEVIEGGIQATIQDYPGRPGMLRQGFFPAGPMDHFAFRAANLLAGNPESAAGLEVTLGAFGLRFETDATIAVSGAEAEVTVDGERIPLWVSHRVRSGTELRIGIAQGPGFRLYVAISGGIDVPPLFGSRATYTMGALGGLDGRALQAGDRLPLGEEDEEAARGRPKRFRDAARPDYAREWEIETIRGPQASPDFLTEEDMETLFTHTWPVDRNSDRTGIRLEPYRFRWARESGGIAGGHPSNILDNSYPVGAINVNGDLPVILGPDGPTAGGFVVAGTLVHAGLWKIGQLRPVGDRLRFREVTIEEAVDLGRELGDRLTDASLEDV